MCFKKRLIHKYIWERVEHGVATDRAVVDYLIVPRFLRGRLFDVNILRAVANGMSDQYLKAHGGVR